MVVFYALLVVFASILVFVHRSGFFVGYALIVGYGFYHGYSLPVITIASFGPAVIVIVVLTILTVLKVRGHFDVPLWIASIDDELRDELSYWELQECAKAASDEEEFQEIVTAWAEQN